jgi:Ni/Fe-hydrogenase 1 B-type cytochrome subunit
MSFLQFPGPAILGLREQLRLVEKLSSQDAGEMAGGIRVSARHLLICKLPIQSMGINALAGIIYSFMYLAIVFQIFTGFALYSVLSPGWFPRLFAWVIPLFGGVQAVRQWHHLFTWIFVAFTMMHIYLSWYHDYLEGRGTISSMIGGWKFIEKTTR